MIYRCLDLFSHWCKPLQHLDLSFARLAFSLLSAKSEHLSHLVTAKQCWKVSCGPEKTEVPHVLCAIFNWEKDFHRKIKTSTGRLSWLIWKMLCADISLCKIPLATTKHGCFLTRGLIQQPKLRLSAAIHAGSPRNDWCRASMQWGGNGEYQTEHVAFQRKMHVLTFQRNGWKFLGFKTSGSIQVSSFS